MSLGGVAGSHGAVRRDDLNDVQPIPLLFAESHIRQLVMLGEWVAMDGEDMPIP